MCTGYWRAWSILPCVKLLLPNYTPLLTTRTPLLLRLASLVAESEAKAEYSPRIDIDAKDHHDPNGSPIAELPVVYSSLESADGGGLGKTLFSQTGSSANALVKDPFAKAEQKANKEKVLSKKLRREQEEEEKEIEALNFARQENERNKRAAAILQQAQYASDNVLGALNGVGSR